MMIWHHQEEKLIDSQIKQNEHLHIAATPSVSIKLHAPQNKAFFRGILQYIKVLIGPFYISYLVPISAAIYVP